jgi:hypothetical protein
MADTPVRGRREQRGAARRSGGWTDAPTSRAALVDDLAALAWGGIAGIFLAGTGIVEELTAPTAPAPSTR